MSHQRLFVKSIFHTFLCYRCYSWNCGLLGRHWDSWGKW